MNSETQIYQIPEFTGEHIPVKAQASIPIISVRDCSGNTQAMCIKGRIKKSRYHFLQ